MSLISLAGWLIIIGSIIATMRIRKNIWLHKFAPSPFPLPRGERVRERVAINRDYKNKDSCNFQSKSWCDAIEKILGAGVFIFDESLKLACAGSCASLFSNRVLIGVHLVDIVPLDLTVCFLDEVGHARRGEMRTWECLWGDKHVLVNAVSLENCRIILSVKENLK